MMTTFQIKPRSQRSLWNGLVRQNWSIQHWWYVWKIQ